MRFLFTLLFFCSMSLCFALNQKYVYDQYTLNLMPDSTFTFNEVSVLTFDLVTGNYLYRNDSIILTTHQYNHDAAIFSIATVKDDIFIHIKYIQEEYISSFPSRMFLSTIYHDNGSPMIERFYEGEIEDGNYYEYHWDKDKSAKSKFVFQNWEKIIAQSYFDNDLFLFPFPKESKSWKNGLAHGKWYYYAYTEDKMSIKFVKTEIYKKGKLKKEKWY